MTEKPRLILVLGDQLTDTLAGLRQADAARDIVVMAEVMAESTAVPHHPQKIALVLAAMRKFARHLSQQGYTVAYSRLDDPQTGLSLAAEILRRAAEYGSDRLIVTSPGDWRLLQALEEIPLNASFLPDDRFLCQAEAFAAWATDRKQLRMEWFYRDMRRRTGLLMDGDQPVGGQWNFDPENRKAAKPDLLRPKPLRFAPDAETEAVLDMVEERFPSHFGKLRPFHWPTDRTEAFCRWTTLSPTACRVLAMNRTRCCAMIRFLVIRCCRPASTLGCCHHLRFASVPRQNITLAVRP